MKVEAGPETSVFRMRGSLRRVDAMGRRIDYKAPASTSHVETDPPIDPSSHTNGFHPNSVNGTGVNTELLTGSRI